MKKLLLLVGTIVLIFALCSCGGKEIEEEKEIVDDVIEEEQKVIVEADIENEYDMSKLQRIDVGDYCYYVPAFADYFETEYQQVAACGDFGVISTYAEEYRSGDAADSLSKTFKGKKVHKGYGGAYVIFERDGKSMAYFLHIGNEGGQIIEIFTCGRDVKPYCEMLLGTFDESVDWQENKHNKSLCELCEYESSTMDFEYAGDTLEYVDFALKCMLEGKGL